MTAILIKLKINIFTAVCLGLLLYSNVYSQQLYVPECGNPLKESWRWTRFDKLTGKGVQCISETSDGSIVFGVNRGVLIYNGLDWKEQNGENGGVDDRVTFLTNTSDKILYAGTEKGIYEIIDQRWNKIFPQGNQSDNLNFKNIRCLIKQNGGGIIASFGSGINRGLLFYKNGQFEILASQKTIDNLNMPKGTKFYRVQDNRCSKGIFNIESVFQDSKNRFWVWESEGDQEGNIFYFEKNSEIITYSKLFTIEDGLVIGKGNKFGEDEKGNIWIINSTLNKGLSVFNEKFWKSASFEGENAHFSIKLVDKVLWIGGYGTLYAHRNGNWEAYNRPEVPIPTSIIFVYNDSHGYLWVAGLEGEITRIDFNGSRWSSFKSLNYHCEDLKGNMWFIDVDGKVVVKNRSDKWYSYDVTDGLPDAAVKVFCTKADMICAVGTYKQQACVSFFNGSTWDRQLFPNLSWGIDYRAVYEDADRNLWIGGSVNNFEEKSQKGGVIKIQYPGKLNQIATQYHPESLVEIKCSYGFAQTKDGTIWHGGTYLSRYLNGKWEQYSEIDALNQYINTMGNTPDGALWIGSRKSGVFHLKDDKWSIYNEDNGLADNKIICIQPVNENNVWLATYNGFGRFDGKSWTNDLFHSDLTLSREGGDLQIQKNGTVWINRYSRAWKRRAIRENIIEKADKEFYSTIVYRNNKLAPDTKISVCSEEVSSLGNTYIEWEGLDYWNETPVSKLQYSFRLNNSEWSEFNKQTNLSLQNLKNGSYLFEVRARDIDFNIDLSPAQTKFIVLPPIWKQAWFIFLIFSFLFVIFIYQYITYRQKKRLKHLNLVLIDHSEEIERKNIVLEEQKDQILQQTIIEKERNQSKIRFFTNISHEFRTPLTIITGIINNLDGKTLIEKPDYCNEQIMIVKKNASQLLHLINQLMDFRENDHRLMKLRVSEIEIVAHINNVCNLFQSYAKKYNIVFQCASSVDKLQGWLDVDKLDKITSNLISNAIKFTPGEGRISVKLNKIELNSSDYLELIVEDTGIGIPDNKIEKIFEPFFQVESSSRTKNEGTGIGLSIVGNYVKLHRGEINVESSTKSEVQLKRAYSTRFIVHLPIEKTLYHKIEIIKSTEKAQSINEAVFIEKNMNLILTSEYELELPGKRTVPHVLIVEDNDDLRHFMQDILKEHYKIIEAKNGDEGYKKALSLLPDIIISDIMMPEMYGSEMCDKIKNDIRTSHIPVILLTALAANEHKIEAFQKGADDYITKPFSSELLFVRIKNILLTRAKLKRKFKNEEALHPDEENVVSMDTVFLKKLKTILEANYNDIQFNVEDLSRENGLSSRHLLHKLKSLVDMTPVEYIKVFRLQKAAQLLSGNKASISEIAYDTGFNDVSYFGKCFFRHYGMTPTEYMKKNKVEQINN